MTQRERWGTGQIVSLVIAVSAITYLSWRILGALVGESPPEPAWEEVVISDPAGTPPTEAPPTEAAEPEPATAEAAPSEPQAAEKASAGPDSQTSLIVQPVDRVRVKIERDGEVWFSGIVCRAGDTSCSRAGALEVPHAREIAVELSDLTRAQVIYNGRQVYPLGNLTAGRRFVFVDDS